MQQRQMSKDFSRLSSSNELTLNNYDSQECSTPKNVSANGSISKGFSQLQMWVSNIFDKSPEQEYSPKVQDVQSSGVLTDLSHHLGKPIYDVDAFGCVPELIN